MATKRMFSKTITNSARFLKMPVDSQTLYFHLVMNADDDGIVEAYPVLKITGNSEDNLRVLAAKNFIRVLNDDLVAHIIDWNEHNLIRADRKIDSIYKDLLLQIVPEVELIEPRPRSDIKKKNLDSPRTDNGQTMDGIGKDRLGKDRLGKVNNKAQNAHFDEDSFNVFWTLYDKKVSKKKAQQAWAKINPDIYQTIYNHVREYRKTKMGKEYPYHPHNYLRGEHWNDEIIITHKDAAAIKSDMSEEEYTAYLQQKAKENEELFQ